MREELGALQVLELEITCLYFVWICIPFRTGDREQLRALKAELDSLKNNSPTQSNGKTTFDSSQAMISCISSLLHDIIDQGFDDSFSISSVAGKVTKELRHSNGVFF